MLAQIATLSRTKFPDRMNREKKNGAEEAVKVAASRSGGTQSVIRVNNSRSKEPCSPQASGARTIPAKLRVDSPIGARRRPLGLGWFFDPLLIGVMSSRPLVLIFLLLVLIFTTQFEWKQQIGEAEANPVATRRRQQALIQKEDAIKEKIILAQEKNIQQLNELVQSLQLQLLHCRGTNTTAHTSSNQQTDDSEADRHEIIDD